MAELNRVETPASVGAVKDYDEGYLDGFNELAISVEPDNPQLRICTEPLIGAVIVACLDATLMLPYTAAAVANSIAPYHRDARSVRYRRPVANGRCIPDFTVELASGDYRLVEIESPRTPPYQERGEEPSQGLTHAEQQVSDWFRYIYENLDSVRREDQMPGLYEPAGEIVIGRDGHLGDRAKERFKRRRSENHRVDLKT